MNRMHSIKRIFSALLLLLFWSTAQATTFSQGLLWKIERPGQAPSYVFGTMHTEDPRVLNLPQAVQGVFDSTSTYVMEALLDESALLAMTSTMLFSDGRSLKEVLPPPTYAKTVSALSVYGLPEMAVQLMQPWALAITLSTPKPKTGVVLDIALMQQATAQGKKTAGLETIEEQVGIFSSLPMSEQVILLEDTLKQLPGIQKLFAEIHNTYLARDLAGLERMSAAQMAQGNPKLVKKIMTQLVEQRNQRMVERMGPYLKSGKAFIAIGALHLPGQAGVLNLLAKKGYRVSVVY